MTIQRRQNRMHRRQHIHSPDSIDSLPLDILPFLALHPAPEVPYPKNMKQYAGMPIIVAVAQQRGKTGYGNTEFFPKFTNQRLFRRFTEFDFPSRKFPLSGAGPARQPLLNQEFTGGILYDADSDRDSLRNGSRH